MYHYTESGLSNVWLVNGYVMHEADYGEGVSIEDFDGLHNAIGDMIVSTPGSLKGEQIRFLRHELDCSQKSLAGLMDVDEQTIARWEKGKTSIPGPADRLIRSYYKHKISGSVDLANLLEYLAHVDVKALDEHHLEHSVHGWRKAQKEAA